MEYVLICCRFDPFINDAGDLSGRDVELASSWSGCFSDVVLFAVDGTDGCNVNFMVVVAGPSRWDGEWFSILLL